MVGVGEKEKGCTGSLFFSRSLCVCVCVCMAKCQQCGLHRSPPHSSRDVGGWWVVVVVCGDGGWFTSWPTHPFQCDVTSAVAGVHGLHHGPLIFRVLLRFLFDDAPHQHGVGQGVVGGCICGCLPAVGQLHDLSTRQTFKLFSHPSPV